MRQATGRDIPDLSAFLRPANNLFPLKVGDELFIDAPDAELNEKMQFRFDVALNEPGVVEGKGILEMLKQVADLVGSTVAEFRPFLNRPIPTAAPTSAQERHPPSVVQSTTMTKKDSKA
jgi:hypothetical protein